MFTYIIDWFIQSWHMGEHGSDVRQDEALGRGRGKNAIRVMYVYTICMYCMYVCMYVCMICMMAW